MPHASILRVGFVSYCHDQSGQQTKTGNNETRSPTRKTDVWATQFISPLSVWATRPQKFMLWRPHAPEIQLYK